MSDNEAVKQAEAKLEQVHQKAEALVQQFNRVVSLYVTELWQYLMKSAVTHKPEVTQSLGEMKLGQLKAKFNEALKTIPSVAEQVLQSVQWAHRQQRPGEYNSQTYYELQKKSMESLDEAIRNQISAVGALLIEYGYEHDKGRHSAWEMKAGGKPHYSYGLPSDSAHAKEYHQLAKQYADLITEDYRVAVTALGTAIRQKKAAEAQALWDGV